MLENDEDMPVNPESQDDLNENNNFGFTPVESEEDKERKKRELPPSVEKLSLLTNINNLICRYPNLVPRTSAKVMAALNDKNELELQNIYTNCLNDLAEIRGTPSSEAVITAITYPINANLLADYTERCLVDVELKRDIESEMINVLGAIGNRLNIFFRLVNNAYASYKKRKIIQIEGEMNKLFESVQEVNETGEYIGPVVLSEENKQNFEEENEYAKAFNKTRREQEDNKSNGSSS